MKPASMNTNVAMNDLPDRRDKPQTPCPLVQPDPSLVPKPTRTPAIIMMGVGVCILRGGNG